MMNEYKKILDRITSSIKDAKTCDDLDMAAFGMLGLLGVEGLDAITEEEQAQLTELTDNMEKLMEQKKAELNCKDDNFWGDDDETPVDEPVEGLE